MVSQYKVGDHVKYHAIGGAGSGADTSTSTGEIVDIKTQTESAGNSGNVAKASEEEPRYVIKNDNTQKETAYKAGNILGLAD
ncbi:hypothetical protein D9756_002907 [Leucocoprinus leucothites]|uniref:Hypervirulence associated protein TUDOR domain-containing protein n=1 Tax=Leucocoprinus leucothites TaxID=201217 RepID=A0A8H5G7A6_9AGAR|nr:hypothetical protein D9756_002907 [Leucoagaricus leucothites]